MAAEDQKISESTEFAGTLDGNQFVPLIDENEASPSDRNKKINAQNLSTPSANGLYGGSDTLTVLNTIAKLVASGSLAFSKNTIGSILKIIESGQVIINGETAQASAVFQIDSITKGLLPPRMDTAQRDAIPTPVEGLYIHNTDVNIPQVYSLGAWVDIGGGSTPSGADGAIQFSGVTDLASDDSNLHWNNIIKSLMIGNNSGGSSDGDKLLEQFNGVEPVSNPVNGFSQQSVDFEGINGQASPQWKTEDGSKISAKRAVEVIDRTKANKGGIGLSTFFFFEIEPNSNISFDFPNLETEMFLYDNTAISNILQFSYQTGNNTAWVSTGSFSTFRTNLLAELGAGNYVQIRITPNYGVSSVNKDYSMGLKYYKLEN